MSPYFFEEMASVARLCALGWILVTDCYLWGNLNGFYVYDHFQILFSLKLFAEMASVAAHFALGCALAMNDFLSQMLLQSYFFEDMVSLVIAHDSGGALASKPDVLEILISSYFSAGTTGWIEQ